MVVELNPPLRVAGIDGGGETLNEIPVPTLAQPQGFLVLLSFSDVKIHTGQAHRLPRLIPEPPPSPSQPPNFSVGSDDTKLTIFRLAAPPRSFDGLHHLVAVIRMETRLPGRLGLVALVRLKPVHGIEFRTPTAHTCVKIPVERAYLRRLLGQRQPFFRDA